MPNTLTKRGGPRAVADAARRPAMPTEGVVVAIVAVTGTEDSVQDIIVPGAFQATLKKRRPKFCWMHLWARPLGRVLAVAELMPGDRRLPSRTPDGRPWPREAGALIATMQFNLKTIDGRDFYEHAKLWALGGEAAFSIGYKVVDGKASKRADGVRMIYALDLYECSLVLHGAHDMALALEVKNSDHMGLEFKDAGVPVAAPAQPDHSDGVMVALYPSPETAAQIAVPGGLEPNELHVTVAYLGKDPVEDPAALVSQIGPAVAAVGPLSGTVGGLGQFPAGDDGTPVWAPVDVPGLDRLRTAVTGALADAERPQTSEHGFTPHMTLGYDLKDAQPVPSTPVEFSDAFLVVKGNRYPIPLSQAEPAPLEAKGIVATLARSLGRDGLLAHLEAKSLEVKAGIPGVADTPSDAAAVERLRKTWTDGRMAAKVGWGTEGDFDRCVTLASEYMTPEDAKGWCNLRHHDALGIYPATHAAQTEGKSAPTQEVKAMTYMRGSQEERRSAVCRAVEDLLLPKTDDAEEGRGWVNVDATFDDYVIASRNSYRGEDESFRISYSFDGEGVTLGLPEPVELSVVAVPDSDDPAPLEEGVDVRLRFVDPATAAIGTAAQLIGALPEGKGLDELETPVLMLLDSLAAKGYDVARAVMGDEEEDPYAAYAPDEDVEPAYDYAGDGEPADLPDYEPDENGPSYASGDEALEDPAEEATETPGQEQLEDDEEGDGDTITLDPEAVRAQREALNHAA